MAASSDRKIEANRRNAAKSTGPKSAEGKEKSRRNGWKHGMAAVVVVPEEETAALDAARAEWAAQIRPENVAEESLVEQMATADVRMNAAPGSPRRRWRATPSRPSAAGRRSGGTGSAARPRT